jgi:hypothetical protein
VVTDPRWGPVELLGQYLLWHAVQICQLSCLVCHDTLEYLTAQGAVPDRLMVLVERARDERARSQGGRRDAPPDALG